MNFASFFIYLFLGASVAIAGEAPPLQPIVLDLEWGKGGLAIWDGGLRIENGRFLKAENTLLESDERVTLISDQEVAWNSTTSGPTDGVRVTVMATPQTILSFISPIGSRRFSVGDLVKHPSKWKIDRFGHELTIQRAKRDTVALSTLRDSYIFAPDEQWPVSWNINLGFAQDDPQISYQVTLTRGRSEVPIWVSEKKKLQCNDPYAGKIVESLKIPHSEGVYTLKVRFTKGAIFLPDQTIQFVVLDPSMPTNTLTASQEMPLHLVDQIDATIELGNDRFRDDGTSHVVNRNALKYRLSGGRAETTFKALNDEATLNWFAYQLTAKSPGKPHILELDYPDDQRRQFIVRIAEKNPVGMANIVIDLGIVSHGERKSGSQAIKTKRIVFWPTTTRPAIALINASTGGGAALQGIRLYEASEGLAANKGGLSNNSLALKGPYLEEPFALQKSLGSTEAPDVGLYTGHGTRPDWQTYYDAISHLSELLKFRGENAFMPSVYTYGDTLYPSTVLASGGRYDSGIDFIDGRDPVQKDIVRLMLKFFERNKITLTPVFAFYRQLPALEKTYPPDSQGRREIDLFDKNGKTVRDASAPPILDQVAPFYNPLHPAVQMQVKQAFREFVDRYKDSSALGDIALQINTTGWTQFPGLSWGYDLETFQNFARDNRINPMPALLLKGAYRERYDYLTSRTIKPLWIKWRNINLAKFYASLADIVHTSNNKRKFALAYMNTFTARYAENDAVKEMSEGVPPEELLAVKGVDPLFMKNIPNIRIWRPLRTPIPYLDVSVKRSAPSHHPATVSLFRNASADGVVEFYDYFETRLSSLKKNWWWPMDDWIVATIVDPENNKGIGAEVKTHFYGGWEIPQ